jgi:hypothetical protein
MSIKSRRDDRSGAHLATASGWGRAVQPALVMLELTYRGRQRAGGLHFGVPLIASGQNTCPAADRPSTSKGRRAVGRVIYSVALALGLAVGWTIPVRAESSLGLTGGLTFGGDQDIMIVDRNGSALSNDMRAAIGPVGGVTSTFWWSHFGLQLDALYWGTSAQAALPGSLKRVQVNQDRGAVLMSLMGRLSFGESRGPFAYGGLGGGFAVIGVDPGQTAVGPGVGALAGVAIPMTPHFRVRMEVRYLLTHDSDPKAGRGVSTEISGGRGLNPGRALFGPHLDTEFVPLLIGLDYIF